MTPSRKQAQSEGGSDPWFYSKGVKAGEFYRETKARTRAVMLDTSWPEEPRVWACLSLHTMGFNRELAVKMEREPGGVVLTVPLRQIDIAQETGIDVKSVHRCVVSLERKGRLLRQTEPVGPGSTERQILCYAIPKKPQIEAANPSTAPARPAASGYDGLPEELARWCRHFKVPAPDAGRLEEMQAMAAELTAIVERFRACCKPEPAQMPLPGITVNRATVAESKKPGPRAVESLSARENEKPEAFSRASQKSLSAREDINRKKDSERTTAAAAPKNRLSWEKAAAVIQSKFPQASADFVAGLAESCQPAIEGAGILTDGLLAEAVQAAYIPTQRTAGLFLKTVPAVLEAWRTSGRLKAPAELKLRPFLSAEDERIREESEAKAREWINEQFGKGKK
ncbi:MAG TPA: hypothetical protein VMQ76_11655 [Terracidiphilus sp.]|jgi:hypothetical protein|nr:hypothetical protein [Terracidiphilus sp.]